MSKKKEFLTHNKLAMTAPKLPGGKWPAKFVVQTYNNNIQFTIFAALEGVANGGIINAGMDPHTAWMVFEAIQMLADTPADADDNIIINVENHAGRGKEKALKTNTVIGKTPEGVMFISVTDPSLPDVKVRFDFNINYYHKIIRKSSKGDFTKGEISCIAAKAWAKMYSEILGTHMVTNYEEPQPYNGGGNKGGGSSYSSGGGSSAPSDSDIPW